MSEKILVTPRSFGQADPEPKELLKEENYKVAYNTTGRHLTEEEMVEGAREAKGIIVGTDPVTAEVIDNAPQLEVISKYGVGLDNIDLSAANRNGVMVTFTPGTNSEAVAELALGLMLDVARNISAVDREVRKGGWVRSRGIELKDKTIGILGTGKIGMRVGELAAGFGMSVICYDIYQDQNWAERLQAEYCSLLEVLKEADIISIHLPLNRATRNLIGEEELAEMKDSSILINTARGGIVELDALVKALQEGTIAGAGFDVFAAEPPQNEGLFELDNMVLTSHIAAHTRESITGMGNLAAQNLIRGLQGEKPDFIVNPEYVENK